MTQGSLVMKWSPGRIVSGEVLFHGGVQSSFEQVLDRELLGEVAAGGLSLSRSVVEVDPAGCDNDIVTELGRHVGALVVQGEVGWCDR